jgi:hypothetical protein
VSVARWTSTARALRWLDAVAAWLALWVIAAVALETADARVSVLAAIATGVGAWLAPLRIRWRPVSAGVGIVVSSRLRPGDRAWYIRPGDAELVLVTGRRGLRMVIALGTRGPAEGISVRRTRILLLPAGAAVGGEERR